ncbi:MBL fold metallo-hydrolase [Streptomyces caniscabiei]|uniref:MBL fold metallo-hydrolase n=1 Tax=Streptomyces caniscabiei TaxID=2746961 RepID=UPI0029BF5A98|nr:MBL fold metallo-hydrolase [Streptomyces caniscabiei]MDX2776285.1 MBL fold metallo-hydrolase [Streptomyces caniscabiei]
MFEIEYKGGNGVVISTKKSRAVIDPKLSVVGLKDIPIKDDIEIATEERFLVNDGTARITIDGPGEYEVGDFSIRGVSAARHLDDPKEEKKATIYRIEVGDTRLAILGNIAPKLGEDQEEMIGVVDILILPVGGSGYTLDATGAASIVRQIDPKVVIPTHYADDGLAYEVPQDSLDIFVKELGIQPEVTSKFKVKSAASLPETLTIMQVTRS